MNIFKCIMQLFRRTYTYDVSSLFTQPDFIRELFPCLCGDFQRPTTIKYFTRKDFRWKRRHSYGIKPRL